MFGLFMAILWVICACGVAIKNSRHDDVNRNIARRNGSDSYIDSSGRRRDLETDAEFYISTDKNGDAWKVYKHGEKPSRNLTAEYRMEMGSKKDREAREYADKNRDIAEREGWRFYRVKKHSCLYDCMKLYDLKKRPELIKGWETKGADVFVDRENGHECIFFVDNLCYYDAMCIYDITDGCLYDWYFCSVYNGDTKRYDSFGSRDDEFYKKTKDTLNRDKERKDLHIKYGSKKEFLADVLYKYEDVRRFEMEEE